MFVAMKNRFVVVDHVLLKALQDVQGTGIISVPSRCQIILARGYCFVFIPMAIISNISSSELNIECLKGRF